MLSLLPLTAISSMGGQLGKQPGKGEAQATDRAHRIGQTSVVTSIKLIARDTVEHRVIAMQEKKRALISGLLDADTPALTSGDWEELLA
jgi:SNF2 family DNA or RNA helicase